MEIKVAPFLEIEMDLGEGPVWSQGEAALYWVDVTQRTVWRPE